MHIGRHTTGNGKTGYVSNWCLMLKLPEQQAVLQKINFERSALAIEFVIFTKP